MDINLLDVIHSFEKNFDYLLDGFQKEMQARGIPTVEYDRRKLLEVYAVLYGASYIEQELFHVAAYVTFMIATRQIFPDGNKRMSLFVMVTILRLNGFTIDFKNFDYEKGIMEMIAAYEEAIPKDRDMVGERQIEILSLAIRLASKRV